MRFNGRLAPFSLEMPEHLEFAEEVQPMEDSDSIRDRLENVGGAADNCSQGMQNNRKNDPRGQGDRAQIKPIHLTTSNDGSMGTILAGHQKKSTS